MQGIDEIYRAIEFIENNLHESITVKDASSAAGFSIFHFSRIFSSMTGHSPYDYIIRRRLTEASIEVLETKKKIIDIAFDFQFNSPENFSRAFRKMFGHLPNSARKTKIINKKIKRSRITHNDIEYLAGNHLRIPTYCKSDSLIIIGFMNEIDSYNQIDTIHFEHLKQFKNEIRDHSDMDNIYGITLCPVFENSKTSFIIGHRTESLDTIPLQMIGKKMPSMNYITFIHQGPVDTLDKMINYIYQTWMPKSGTEPAAPFELLTTSDPCKATDDPNLEISIHIPITESKHKHG